MPTTTLDDENGGTLTETDDTPVLQLQDIDKSYGAIQALAGVDLSVRRGEVVALVGDNGAGKSTLVKVVSGVHQPDRGLVVVAGEVRHLRTPKDAVEAGIHTVYQDLALAPNLDVVENLFLGQEETRPFARRWIRRPDDLGMERKGRDFLADLGLKTIKNIRAPVASLSGGQRQTIAIARAIREQCRVLLLDEPTAALGVHESRHVLDLVHRLRQEHMAVLVVSHNMHEVFEVADRIAVLRLGRITGILRKADVSQEDVVAAIMGVGPLASSKQE